MTIRTRREADIVVVIAAIDDALEDIVAFIEATEKCNNIGIYTQSSSDVMAMLQHLQKRLTLALVAAI